MALRRRPRGRPFPPGNRGRPPGSKNKVTAALEQLADGDAEELVRKVLQLAKDGDVSCMRMAVDRVWPCRKGRTVYFDMPEVKSARDIPAATAALMTAAAKSEITPEEANTLSMVLERSANLFQQEEILKRLEDLERRKALADEQAEDE